MPYSYITLGQLKTQLAGRLYDSGIFWTDAEGGVYILQSIRTWNSLTNYWRKEFTLDSQEGLTWYDLANIVSVPNTVRPMTVTNGNIVSLIEYMLLEPSSSTYPLAWTGSLQFTMTDILNAIQRRRDEILSVTGCTVNKRVVPAVAGRTFLPDSTIDIRRVAWLPVSSPAGYVNSPLYSDDEFGTEAFESDYTTQGAGQPETYRQSAQPPLSFDVDRQPAVPGQYEILTVDAGAEVTINELIMTVPDDFMWVIVFGVLSDLLNRESNAKDSLRAQYCEARYRQGLMLLQSSSALLFARVNNIPVSIDSVQEEDDFRSDWQAETPGQPDTIVTAGLNLIGMVPTPDDGGYSILLGAVMNAPLPLNDGDFIQAGKDVIEALLDYAQHLASFKMGGLEFLSTTPLLERFHKVAAIYNSKLNELGEFTKPMYEQSQLQTQDHPVLETNPLTEE